jgi:hypothetical protein
MARDMGAWMNITFFILFTFLHRQCYAFAAAKPADLTGVNMKYFIATAAACCVLAPAWAGLYAVGGRVPLSKFDTTYATEISGAKYEYAQLTAGTDILKLTATNTSAPRMEIIPKINMTPPPPLPPDQPIDPAIETGRRWYALSVFVPSVNDANQGQSLANADVSLARIDLKPTQEPAQSPLMLKVEKNALVLLLQFRHSADAPLANKRIVLEQDFKYNQWHCLIINANWHANPGPTTDLAHESSMRVTWNGKTAYDARHTYNSQPGQSLIPKTGFLFNSIAPNDFTMYSDFMYVGYNDNSTLEQLRSRTPCAD